MIWPTQQSSQPSEFVLMTDTKFTLDREVHNELKELIEDSLEYFCDENMISGELAWIVVQCLAEAKIEQLRGNIL